MTFALLNFTLRCRRSFTSFIVPLRLSVLVLAFACIIESSTRMSGDPRIIDTLATSIASSSTSSMNAPSSAISPLAPPAHPSSPVSSSLLDRVSDFILSMEDKQSLIINGASPSIESKKLSAQRLDNEIKKTNQRLDKLQISYNNIMTSLNPTKEDREFMVKMKEETGCV